MDTPEEQSGLSRRSVLKRGAIVGGAMVWTVPAVQSIAGPAAAGTGCVGSYTIINDRTGQCVAKIVVTATDACCQCIDANDGSGSPAEVFFAALTCGPCSPQLAPC